MNLKKIRAICFATSAFAIMSSSALAGGFDRGGVNIDGLFSDGKFNFQTNTSYVNVTRTRKDISRTASNVLSVSASC